MSFAEFVLEYQPRASWFYQYSLSDLLAAVRLDGLVRFDRLEEDLHRLPPIAAAIQAGAELEPLPRFNETSYPPWQEICTPRLAEVIAYRWGADLGLCQAQQGTSPIGDHSCVKTAGSRFALRFSGAVYTSRAGTPKSRHARTK